jgi:hypothetical protein
MTAISRAGLLAAVHRLKRERDQLLEMCAKQRIFIEEQRAAYHRLVNDLHELRGQLGQVKALGIRYGLLCKAADAEREQGAPLQ